MTAVSIAIDATDGDGTGTACTPTAHVVDDAVLHARGTRGAVRP